MAIYFNQENKSFHLQTKGTSYVMQVIGDNYLCSMYWGKKIRNFNSSNPLLFMDRGFSPNPTFKDRTFSLDTIPQEYPAYGNGDYRSPAYQLQLGDGSTISDLRYKEHTIYSGKKPLNGLPAIYTETDEEADTLEITMVDEKIKLTVVLTYTAMNNYDAITRSVRFINEGNEDIKLLRVLSASFDFRDDEFELLSLTGGHINERNISKRPLVQGTQIIDSVRGASSHQQNPFFALLRKGTNEETGEVYAFNLVYSGNFMAQIQVDQFHTTRASIGINAFDFTWTLSPEDQFQAPEVVMVYSAQGLGEMSRTFSTMYQNRLCRGKFRNTERPILINNWEATYFNFDAEKIEQIAKSGKALGIELMVLDDGWFGNRDDDFTSLGDWVVDKRKLPNGIDDLADRVTSLGMQFGLWFEPEMISEESNLYKVHPDWCIHVPGRPFTRGRSQLILDLTRNEVCDYIIESVSSVLSSAKISYVKWDMNRHMTEIGSSALTGERQRETAHRYMLGLYRVMEVLTSSFPDVLFESCSGGGGRFDPGMLYYMPQVWTSDNTDAISRLKIQYGTSLLYPISSMGSHVSTVPNHQVGRITPLETRGHVAMSGNLGYELDLTKLSEAEKKEMASQISLYKEIRSLIQFGTFYRILNPFEGNEAAWSFVSSNAAETILFYFKVLSLPADAVKTVKFKGLDSEGSYRNLDTGEIFGGDELMNVGVTVPFMQKDFVSCYWRFKRI